MHIAGLGKSFPFPEVPTSRLMSRRLERRTPKSAAVPTRAAPEPSTKLTNDCYSAGEREAMLRNQEWRGRILGPLLKFLTRCRVTPDHITILSTLAGVAFCPLYFMDPMWALLALLAHVLLDGLDGPLARFQNRASRRGSFTDTMADQTIIFVTTLTLMSAGVVNLIPGCTYLFVYTLVVAFAMIRNALKIPYSWLVRPRFIVYAWIAVEIYWLPGSLNYVLATFDAVLSWKLLTGFYKLRNRLGELEPVVEAAPIVESESADSLR